MKKIQIIFLVALAMLFCLTALAGCTERKEEAEQYSSPENNGMQSGAKVTVRTNSDGQKVTTYKNPDGSGGGSIELT